MSYFTTTQWSLVMAAGQGSEQALEALCQKYHPCVVAYFRSGGASASDALDLTQKVFVELLRDERRAISSADRSKGRFRNYLLGIVKRVRAREWRQAHAEKRGGGREVISLDATDEEGQPLIEPSDGVTQELVFARHWAVRVLDQAHTRLKERFEAAGKPEVFERLQGLLQEKSDPDGYAAIADELGRSEAAIKMEVVRMRKDYSGFLLEVVRETATDTDEAHDELRYLLQVLRC